VFLEHQDPKVSKDHQESQVNLDPLDLPVSWDLLVCQEKTEAMEMMVNQVDLVHQEKKDHKVQEVSLVPPVLSV
jgi:hypothetical protein